MPEISAVLNSGVSLSEMASWKGAAVCFRVRKDSGLAPLGEGIALGELHALVRARSRISIETTFPVEPKQSPDSAASLPFFDSAFGLAITAASSAVHDSRGRDVRDTLRRYLWKRLKTTRGVLGIGSHMAVVAYDPHFPIPPCLQLHGHEFPLRDHVRATLLALAKAMGRRYDFVSLSEEDVITFLYEASKNSYDHARTDANGEAITGVRGILLERLSFTNQEEIRTRRDLHALVRDYILRSFATSQTTAFQTYTVSDVGPGIHNTLPSRPLESAFERLRRAFRAGESRRPSSGDVHRGRGLDLLLTAARSLRAFLLIRSGDLLAFADGSGDDYEIKAWPESLTLGNAGTSLSLIWPMRAHGGDLLDMLDQQ